MSVRSEAWTRDRLEATVTTMHGPLVRVRSNGDEMVVPARHRLRWRTAPRGGRQLVVGDRVIVEKHRGEHVVTEVLRRRTLLLRGDERTGRPKAIAANIDQTLIVLAAARPRPNRRLLDRFLVAAHHAGIDPVVVINKTDLGTEHMEGWLKVYRDLRYMVMLSSVRAGRGIDEIGARLAGRTSLLCGPSGAGKSSLLNAVQPGLSLRVGDVSRTSGKGRHTTTAACLLPLAGGGFVVDTPGIKAFGLWDLEAGDVVAAFPEVAEAADGCRFSDCSHSREPGCAVREAVDSGEIDPERFRSYMTLRDEVAAQSEFAR